MAGENILDWSQTAASNSSADSSINYAEGQAPSSLNDSARSVMAAIRKWLDYSNGSITSAGSANAQTITTGVSFASYQTSLCILFKAGATNTGNVTLNVDTLGAKAVLDVAGAQLPAGAITSGYYYLVRYDGTQFRLVWSSLWSGTFYGAVAKFGPSSASTFSSTNAQLNVAFSGAGAEYGAVFRPAANAATYLYFENAAGTGVGAVQQNSTTGLAVRSAVDLDFLTTSGTITFSPTGTEQGRVTNGGGVSNWRFGLAASSYSSALAQLSIGFTGTGTQYGIALRPQSNGSTYLYFDNAAGTNVGAVLQNSTTGVAVRSAVDLDLLTTSGIVTFSPTGTEQGRVSNSAAWRMGLAASSYSGSIGQLSIGFTGAGTQYGIVMRPQSNGATYLEFDNAAGTGQGSITQSGTAATLYNTSSDAELKEDFQPFDAEAFFAAVRVYDFQWKGTEERSVGVVAQELYDIEPRAVSVGETQIDPETGAVRRRHWGVDYSKLVPHLIAKCQNLEARLAALEAR